MQRRAQSRDICGSFGRLADSVIYRTPSSCMGVCVSIITMERKGSALHWYAAEIEKTADSSSVIVDILRFMKMVSPRKCKRFYCDLPLIN